MIHVCELLPTGKVMRRRFREDEPGTADPVLVLQWALPIARQIRHELKRPCWIEREGQPASVPTIEMDARWALRWADTGGPVQ